jgi:hypothetical protein
VLDPDKRTFELFDRQGSISGREPGAGSLDANPGHILIARADG